MGVPLFSTKILGLPTAPTRYHRISMTEAYIRDALRDCYDPEIPLNIIDLGVVHSLEIQLDATAPGAGIPGVPPRHRVSLTLLPTSRDEAAHAQLRAQIENRLAGLAEVSRTQFRLLATPVWTPALISPEGRRQLKLSSSPPDAPAFPILNNNNRRQRSN